MNIQDYFDRAYVVNLPERTDRRQAVELELKKAGMPLTHGKVEVFPAYRPIDAGGFPSIGARGCFQSHLAILQRAQAERLNNVLVMEDDLTISEKFVAAQGALVERLRQNDWGFVYIGHTQAIGNDTITLQPFSDALITTHCYGVNAVIFDRLLAFLDELQHRPPGHPSGGPMHLDGAYSTFRAQNPDILTLIAAPSLAGQRSSRSDVAPNRLYDRLPIVKQLVGMARTGRQWLKQS